MQVTISSHCAANDNGALSSDVLSWQCVRHGTWRTPLLALHSLRVAVCYEHCFCALHLCVTHARWHGLLCSSCMVVQRLAQMAYALWLHLCARCSLRA